MSPLAVVLLHLGKLHPYEHALVWLLAFGPFVVLFLAVRVARRRADDESGQEVGQQGAQQGEQRAEQEPAERRD